MPEMPQALGNLGAWVKAHPKASIALLVVAVLIGLWMAKNVKSAPKAELASDTVTEDAAGEGIGGVEDELLPGDFDQIIPGGLLPEYTVTPTRGNREPAYTAPIAIPTSSRETIVRMSAAMAAAGFIPVESLGTSTGQTRSMPDVQSYRLPSTTIPVGAISTGETRSMPNVTSYRKPTTHEQTITVKPGRTSPLTGGT